MVVAKNKKLFCPLENELITTKGTKNKKVLLAL
jgi:hypothetical protein